MFGFLACVAVYSKGYHACLNLDPTKEQNIIFKHWWNDVDSWIMFWVFNIQLNCFISIMDFCWNLLFPKYDDMSMSIDFFLYWKISSSSSSLLSSSQFSYHHYHHLHYYHDHQDHHNLHHHHHNFHIIIIFIIIIITIFLSSLIIIIFIIIIILIIIITIFIFTLF